MEGQIEFCQEGTRCAGCPFRLFHDEAVRSVVGVVIEQVVDDKRPVSVLRETRLIKARRALQSIGIKRPDSRQVNAVTNAVQLITADESERLGAEKFCAAYDVNGPRRTVEE